MSLTGSRTTTAVAGMAGLQTPVGTVLLDDVTLSNAGLSEDTAVIVAAATVYGARSVTLSGSTMTTQSVSPATLRQALLGKVLTVGDAVSLLPRDLGPGTSTSTATRALASAVGISWTSELLTVTGVDPAGPVSVQPNSLVTWGTGVPADRLAPARRSTNGAGQRDAAPVTVNDLKGVSAQAAKLTEWLKLALDEPHLLQTLGAGTNLGVLVSGPAGVGKTTLVRAVCAGRRLVELDGPEVGALAADDRLKRVTSAVAAVRDGGAVLLIADVDALLPATAEPVATLILAELRKAVATPRVALIVTSALPENLDSRLRAPDLCDRELVLEPARRGHPHGAAGRSTETGTHRRSRRRRDRRPHTRFRGRRSRRPGARGGVARRRQGQLRRHAAQADPGRPARCADRDQAAVPLGRDRGDRSARSRSTTSVT